jgi:hypothetical protein
MGGSRSAPNIHGDAEAVEFSSQVGTGEARAQVTAGLRTVPRAVATGGADTSHRRGTRTRGYTERTVNVYAEIILNHNQIAVLQKVPMRMAATVSTSTPTCRAPSCRTTAGRLPPEQEHADCVGQGELSQRLQQRSGTTEPLPAVGYQGKVIRETTQCRASARHPRVTHHLASVPPSPPMTLMNRMNMPDMAAEQMSVCGGLIRAANRSNLHEQMQHPRRQDAVRQALFDLGDPARGNDSSDRLTRLSGRFWPRRPHRFHRA